MATVKRTNLEVYPGPLEKVVVVVVAPKVQRERAQQAIQRRALQLQNRTAEKTAARQQRHAAQ